MTQQQNQGTKISSTFHLPHHCSLQSTPVLSTKTLVSHIPFVEHRRLTTATLTNIKQNRQGLEQTGNLAPRPQCSHIDMAPQTKTKMVKE